MTKKRKRKKNPQHFNSHLAQTCLTTAVSYTRSFAETIQAVLFGQQHPFVVMYQYLYYSWVMIQKRRTVYTAAMQLYFVNVAIKSTAFYLAIICISVALFLSVGSALYLFLLRLDTYILHTFLRELFQLFHYLQSKGIISL